MPQIKSTTRLEKAINVATRYSTLPIVSTLQVEDIRPYRVCGNTTRQVDYAIDKLFAGNVVICLDHFADGESDLANSRLLDIVLRRLDMEHQRVSKDMIEVNTLYCFVYLK